MHLKFLPFEPAQDGYPYDLARPYKHHTSLGGQEPEVYEWCRNPEHTGSLKQRYALQYNFPDILLYYLSIYMHSL